MLRALACALLAACTGAAADAIVRAPKPLPAPTCAAAPVCPGLHATPSLASIPQWAHIEALLDGPPDRLDLAALNLWISQARNASVDVAANLAALDRMARTIARSYPARGCDHRCRVAALNRYLFEQQHFHSEFDPNGLYRDVDRDLLDRILATRVGYCEGLTFLYLALGERLGIPLAAVNGRQHMFVRYVGPQGPWFDIDPTQDGRAPTPAVAHCAAAAGVYDAPVDARTLAGQMLGVLAIAPGFVSLPWLDRAVRLAPRAPELRNNRGIERARAQDAHGALEDYTAARQLDPCEPLFAMNEARLRFGLGDHAEAQRIVEETDARFTRHEIDEGHAFVTLTRASFAFESGDDTATQHFLEDAYAESDGAPVVLEAVAAVRVGEGRLDQAVEAMRLAVGRDPSVRTRVGLALALLEDARPGEAMRQLDRAQREQPIAGSLDLHLAMLAASLAQPGVARRLAQQCLDRLGQRCARALVVLGDVARGEGDATCAAAYYDAFLSCPVPIRTRGFLRIERTVRERRERLAGTAVVSVR